MFLSVFSVLIYIFEEVSNATKQLQSTQIEC
jgi:hypothetical protein